MDTESYCCLKWGSVVASNSVKLVMRKPITGELHQDIEKTAVVSLLICGLPLTNHIFSSSRSLLAINSGNSLWIAVKSELWTTNRVAESCLLGWPSALQSFRWFDSGVQMSSDPLVNKLHLLSAQCMDFEEWKKPKAAWSELYLCNHPKRCHLGMCLTEIESLIKTKHWYNQQPIDMLDLCALHANQLHTRARFWSPPHATLQQSLPSQLTSEAEPPFWFGWRITYKTVLWLRATKMQATGHAPTHWEGSNLWSHTLCPKTREIPQFSCPWFPSVKSCCHRSLGSTTLVVWPIPRTKIVGISPILVAYYQLLLTISHW